MDGKTVNVKVMEGQNALLMTWQRDVDKDDVRSAYHEMMEHLNMTSKPMYIIVDIQSNPRFPLAETISGAFWGPFRHKMLAEWLVVGSSSLARNIGRTLTGITLRDNIRWFGTMEEAVAYLESISA